MYVLLLAKSPISEPIFITNAVCTMRHALWVILECLVDG